MTIVGAKGIENVFASAIGACVNAALQTETALTAAGSTAARGLATAGYSKASYQIDVATIGANVVVRLEGSNDNTHVMR